MGGGFGENDFYGYVPVLPLISRRSFAQPGASRHDWTLPLMSSPIQSLSERMARATARKDRVIAAAEIVEREIVQLQTDGVTTIARRWSQQRARDAEPAGVAALDT